MFDLELSMRTQDLNVEMIYEFTASLNKILLKFIALVVIAIGIKIDFEYVYNCVIIRSLLVVE